MKKTNRLIVFLLALFLFTAPCFERRAAAADGEEIAMWSGAAFCSLLYTPIKGVVALLMALGGGLSLAGTAFTDQTDLSMDIVKWGYNGDWLIRPDHLTLENYPQIIGFDDEIHFIE